MAPSVRVLLSYFSLVSGKVRKETTLADIVSAGNLLGVRIVVSGPHENPYEPPAHELAVGLRQRWRVIVRVLLGVFCFIVAAVLIVIAILGSIRFRAPRSDIDGPPDVFLMLIIWFAIAGAGIAASRYGILSKRTRLSACGVAIVLCSALVTMAMLLS